MKKKMLRLTALALALVLCFGMTALAVENDKMTITGVNGVTVTFDETVDEKINVTYVDEAIKEGQYYLVMVVAKTVNEETGEVTYVPTKDTILYINQTEGQAGKLVFGSESDNAIYPSAIKDSAILIYGTGVNGEADSLIAAIIEGKYLIGDVNDDGEITTRDAMLIAQWTIGLDLADNFVEAAADVNGEEGITTRDAMLIAQWTIGLIDKLPAA